jgi:ribonuclease Z
MFSTWILVEDWGLLFDAGDGVVSSLLQTSRKAKTIAISHADRDHVTGLLQLNLLNAQAGIERLLYPADSGSFPALREFMAKFDPHTSEAFDWIPVVPGQKVSIGGGRVLEVVSNTHVDSDLVKSVGYRVLSSKRKLKSDLADLPSLEIEALALRLGKEAITEESSETVLGYAGDTGVEPAAKWAGCQTLIHEATFIDRNDAVSTKSRNLHSILEDVLQMAAEASPGQLILHHFSTRYSAETVKAEIARRASDLKIAFPIYAILTGEVVFDLLSRPPVYGA